MSREPYLSVKALVEKQVIPLGKTRLYEMFQKGEIRSYRVGRRVMVLESEVLDDIRKKFQKRKESYGRLRLRQKQKKMAS